MIKASLTILLLCGLARAVDDSTSYKYMGTDWSGICRTVSNSLNKHISIGQEIIPH